MANKKLFKYSNYGSNYELVPEPDNQYDPNALKVYHLFKSGGRAHLGYVPRKRAAEVKALMDTGWKPYIRFACKIVNEETGETNGLVLRFVDRK